MDQDDEHDEDYERGRKLLADAQETHRGNLAAVAALLRLERETSPGPWVAWRQAGPAGELGEAELMQDPYAVFGDTVNATDRERLFPLVMSQQGHPGRLIGADAFLLAALRNGARAALEARQTVLNGHGPNDTLAAPRVIECRSCEWRGDTEAWPCEPYQLAAAGLVMPHYCVVTDPAGMTVGAECVCCGWTYQARYARATGATVAARLAAIRARRHEAGLPDTDKMPASAGGEQDR